jgi:hypothetical protein
MMAGGPDGWFDGRATAQNGRATIFLGMICYFFRFDSKQVKALNHTKKIAIIGCIT